MNLTKAEHVRLECLKIAASQVKGKVETIKRAELYEVYIEGDETLLNEMLHDHLGGRL